jgi:signal transduction histidine kinase
VYPEYPPRVRLEWLIATARVAIAVGAFIAVWIAPPSVFPRDRVIIDMILGWYTVYSLLVLGMVWAPVRFARGWDLAVHTFDLVAFPVLLFFSPELPSPFYLYFVFVVICGTLRWQTWGAFWTTVASLASYVIVSLYLGRERQQPPFAWNAFVVRSVHLAMVAGLVAAMAAYQRRYQHEISRLVSWPRKIPPDAHALLGEILAESAEILGAPRILLLWDEPGEGYVNLAWRSDGEVLWTQESESAYGSAVIPGLEGKNFQTANAADERGAVVHWSGGSFRQRNCRPVTVALQRRFAMQRVQSWTLDGELIRGRLFCLDKRKMQLDDLMFGVLVARLAVSRLDGLYLVKRLRDAAALEERLRLARDLHDSLLQSVAGSALQLLAARRLFERDPVAGAQRLAEVQDQLEHDELEMRSFIRRLRPSASPNNVGSGLNQRLEDLRGRVERQWEIKVELHVDETTRESVDGLADEVYRIVQEGVLNAARHADASVINVGISMIEDGLRIEIVDDGRGFPFRGTYDLNSLNEMERGPLTLKERVAELRGDLKLRSAETGTELLIRLPVSNLAV